jgi:hypothetical protein
LMMPLAGGNVRLQNLLHIGLACAHHVKKWEGTPSASVHRISSS